MKEDKNGAASVAQADHRFASDVSSRALRQAHVTRISKLVSGLFDREWYLAQNPDVAATGMDPLQHYITFGANEGRDPNPLFFSRWYVTKNPEILESRVNPLQHFVQPTLNGGSHPNPLFDSSFYLEANPDVAATGLNPLEHYLKVGAQEGRDPHPLFRSKWYAEQNPEIGDSNPLGHYLRWGARHLLSPHPLFDSKWYVSEYPDTADNNSSPLEHYLTRGAAEGKKPHFLFETQWYVASNPELLPGGINPLVHYLRYGGRQGLDPHPLFSSTWYLAENPDVADAGLNPLLHYVVEGAKEGRSPHPLFDTAFYLEQFLDEAGYPANALSHYLSVGWKRGLRPNAHFDPSFYLRAYPDVREAGIEPLTDYIIEGRVKGRMTSAAGVDFQCYHPSFEISREPEAVPLPAKSDVKAIAFYLPQFHRTPENDAWWGEGFTEWTSVRRGTPNFAGHYQPHVPGELGYYDLENAEVLARQAALAKGHGIYGFCFYYYWFGGQVLLDQPLRQLVDTGHPDIPFCICWANENWTRRWDGLDQEVLMSQNHSVEDDLAFIRHVEPILLAKNYIRVGGKPMLLVYRPSLFPNAAATAERWRDYFRKRGHGELHLAVVRSFTEGRPEFYGFDAVLQFPPHSHATPVTPLIEGADPAFRGYVYDYSELRRTFIHELESVPQGVTAYPGVMPSWDNTARRLKKATTWVNTCPEAYFEWLTRIVEILRARQNPEDRLLFINAWNEWAEGCHLEPDEKFGYAWLNATALALQEPSRDPGKAAGPVSYPDPPVIEPIQLFPLAKTPKLVISVLFYHREDIIASFLRALLPQIKEVTADACVVVELYLVFNYAPTETGKAEIRRLISEILPAQSDLIHIVENGFNVGFGAGHNAIFARSESDIFLMLNSDVRVAEQDWLRRLVERFRNTDAAIIGLAATASRLREDACGIPIVAGEVDFDFVDGSALAIRSDLARRYGLFSSAFDYFYFEDVDLCLRYRQLGLQLDLLDLPYEHERSSSSRLLPQYVMENVLDRNRARFFQRWEGYLKTRNLPNRLGVRFLTIDRRFQCASLPAIFGLLSEHPEAILDIWGVHEQLIALYRHPRLRLIPSWQSLREGDYLRYYELAENAVHDEASVSEIARRLGCVSDVEGARAHLLSVSPLQKNKGKKALFYLSRKEPLFDGRQPEPASFIALYEMLRDDGWQLDLLTDLGRFEIEDFKVFGKQNTVYSGTATGLAVLKVLAASELVISCDSWISELSQLLNKKTFVWLGATAPSLALWNWEKAGFFHDRELPCLGCYHRFGAHNRNTCLRGDIACMRQELSKEVCAALQRFLEGEPITIKDLATDRNPARADSAVPSPSLTLESWPESTAHSILVLIPINPRLDKVQVERARELAMRATRGMQNCRIVLDDAGTSPPRGVPHPLRQPGMAAIRQGMITRHLKDERWVFWVDADIVEYPENLIDQLVSRAEGGIAAPMVLMEGNADEPLSNKYGFGPGRFYDVAGFVETGRWARFEPPFFDQLGPVYQLDSVGSCYLVNADLYRRGAKHKVDPASKKFIDEDRAWTEDSIARNQAEAANCFSEHYSVCEFTRRAGLPVRAFADLIARHEKALA
jgi:GT2 family glycosyltransferase